MKLAHLTPAHVQTLRDRLTAEGRSRDLVQRVVISLGALLGSAMNYGKVAKTSCTTPPDYERAATGGSKAATNASSKSATKDEIRAMLNAAEGRWRPLIVTAIFTGLRASELRGLTWNDVGLDAGTLTGDSAPTAGM